MENSVETVNKRKLMLRGSERFQTHCQICCRPYEADSREQVVALVVEHERKFGGQPHSAKDKEPEDKETS